MIDLIVFSSNILKWYYIYGIQLNSEAKNVINTYWVISAIVDADYELKKEDFLRTFKENGIDSRPFFYPISSMPPYKKYSNEKNMASINKISYELSPRGISFPSFAMIKEEEVDFIVNVFRKILQSK